MKNKIVEYLLEQQVKYLDECIQISKNCPNMLQHQMLNKYYMNMGKLVAINEIYDNIVEIFRTEVEDENNNDID